MRNADAGRACARRPGAQSVRSGARTVALIVYAVCSPTLAEAAGDSSYMQRELLKAFWAALPWTLWVVFSAAASAIVFFAAPRGLRARISLFVATLIACGLALWPPHAESLHEGGVKLTLQVATAEGARAARDDASATVRRALTGKGLAYGRCTPTSDTSFAVEGLNPSREPEARSLFESQLGSAWVVTTGGSGRIEARLTPAAVPETAERTMSETRRRLERRLSGLGLAGTSIVPGPSSDEIQLELYGVRDLESAKRVLLTNAQLAFQLVWAAESTREALLAPSNGQVPEGLVVLTGPGQGQGEIVHYLLEAEPIVSSRDLESARVGVDASNKPAIRFHLDRAGAEKFGDFTGRHIGRQVAIVLNGEVETVPTIQGKVGADGLIQGRFTAQEADELAGVLTAGALPASLRVLREVQIPARTILGLLRRAAAVSAVAFVAACLLVFLFHRVPPVVAALMLFGVVIVTWAAMLVLQGTVALPGVAILVTAVGVALDRALSTPGAAPDATEVI